MSTGVVEGFDAPAYVGLDRERGEALWARLAAKLESGSGSASDSITVMTRSRPFNVGERVLSHQGSLSRALFSFSNAHIFHIAITETRERPEYFQLPRDESRGREQSAGVDNRSFTSQRRAHRISVRSAQYYSKIH